MAFSVRTIEAFCYRYPLSTPVVTSFGRMLNRPAVFVRAEDEDGQRDGCGRLQDLPRRPAGSHPRH